jgi:hypothetical protein
MFSFQDCLVFLVMRLKSSTKVDDEISSMITPTLLS